MNDNIFDQQGSIKDSQNNEYVNTWEIELETFSTHNECLMIT